MISPWESKYHRPRLRRETREFTLPDGRVFSLTLEEADQPAVGLIHDEWQELAQRYVGTAQQPALPVALPDGTLLRASQSMCRGIAQLSVLQRPEQGHDWAEGERPFSFLDWVGVMTNWPATWSAALAFSNEMVELGDRGGAAESPPEPPPAEGREPIATGGGSG